VCPESITNPRLYGASLVSFINSQLLKNNIYHSGKSSMLAVYDSLYNWPFPNTELLRINAALF